MAIQPYATIAFAFDLPIEIPCGTEITVRGPTRNCEYPHTLKLRRRKNGQCVAVLTDPANDKYEFVIDRKRGKVSLMDAIPWSMEDGEVFAAQMMLIVGELVDRLRPSSYSLDEDAAFERDKPLYALIEAGEQRWENERRAVLRLGSLELGLGEQIH